MTKRRTGTLPGKKRERDPHALTHREALFVLKYLELDNATEAYLQAGYATTRQGAGASGARMLSVVRVAEAVERARAKRIANAAIDADEAFRRLAVIAGFDIGDLLNKDGKPLPLKDLPPDVRRVIKRVDGEGNIYTHDVMRALELIAETGGKLRKPASEENVALTFDHHGYLVRIEARRREKQGK